MSGSELEVLVASDERLQADGIRVSLAEKGFGTRVVISADAEAGLVASDLEALLNQMASPQKRPFENV